MQARLVTAANLEMVHGLETGSYVGGIGNAPAIDAIRWTISVLCCAALIFAGSDVRHRRIPNLAVMALFTLAAQPASVSVMLQTRGQGQIYRGVPYGVGIALTGVMTLLMEMQPVFLSYSYYL